LDLSENISWVTTRVGVLVVTSVVLAVCLVFGLLPLFFYKDAQDAGAIGDAFGGVNALFSGLAFSGLVVTLYMQRQELELQRNELRCTLDEHRKMAKAQEETEKRLFLSAYLNALESLRQISYARLYSPRVQDRPTIAMCQGLVYENRVVESLTAVLTNLEPTLRQLLPEHDQPSGPTIQQELDRLLFCVMTLWNFRLTTPEHPNQEMLSRSHAAELQAIDTALAECLAKITGKAHLLIAQAREDLAQCHAAFWPQIGKARNQLQEAIEELTRN
jgi:hypothetical protein